VKPTGTETGGGALPAGSADVNLAGNRKHVAPELQREVPAVMSAPERSRASTTIVASASPATIRLRAGKRRVLHLQGEVT
jgi:hypothetical protein